MSLLHFSALSAVMTLAAVVPASAGKTTLPERVKAAWIDTKPYRYNGVVTTTGSRGSGFCAGDRRILFTAAHMVFEGSDWVAPPIWHPQTNGKELKQDQAIQTRGYLRWRSYAELATSTAPKTPSAFNKDVAVCFSFKPLISGKPARLDFRGRTTLMNGANCMITGYPAKNPYLDKDIKGYFMHRTKPQWLKFKAYSGNAVQTTLITTGPGNSGGPVWTGNKRAGWKASGVLVGGLPSETIVHALGSDTRKLYGSARRMLAYEGSATVGNNIGATSVFYRNKQRTVIPDGVHKWTVKAVEVGPFADSIVENVHLSLNIATPHRGDLQVFLTSPDGTSALIHNEEGANKKNLVINNMDLSATFTGLKANGRWRIHIQDRLKGDRAVFNHMRLELVFKDEETTPTP